MRNNTSIITLCLLFSLWSTACNQAKTENTAGTETAVEEKAENAAQLKPTLASSKNFKKQVDGIASEYLATKDALVASDTTQTNSKIASLLESIRKVDASSLSSDVQQKWSAHQQSLTTAAQSLQTVKDIEAKRASFEDLSKTMYQVITDFGTSSTLYKQYCPMALNDKGAFWLSAQSDIKNPYFGDAMLTCGEVQETLTFSE